MAWFGLDVQCPGCKMQKTPVKFRRPGFMKPSFTNFKCETCESHVAVNISQHPDITQREQGRVSVKVKIMTKGDTLLALEEDERNHLQNAENQD